MKTVLVIFSFLLFWIKSYGQVAVSICGNQNHSGLLKASKQVTDSLRNSGIDSIIIYNNYGRDFDYSKILWASGSAVNLIQIFEEKLEKGFRKKTTQKRILESGKQFDLLNLSTLKAASIKLKDCGGFVAPLPYHFLYLYINGQESCIKLLEDQLECNTDNNKVKLIKELIMEPEEFYELAIGKN